MLRAAICSFLAVALAQSTHLEFDAASIKLNTRDVPWQDTRDNCGLNGMGFVNILAGGRVRAERTLLSCIIQGAYQVRAFQVIGGPDWVNSIHYDVEATAGFNAPPEQIRIMLQALLADRFKLKLHKEIRQAPIYVLRTARGGSKLRPPKPGSCVKPGTPAAQPSLPAPPPAGRAPAPMVFPCGRMGGVGSPGGSRMDGGDVPISELVRLLVNQLHQPVIDKTGLTGTYDIHLAYAGTIRNAESATETAPTLIDALQEQLGLKLESAKGPVDVLVISFVQMPAEN